MDNIDIFGTHTLAATVGRLDRPGSFLLDTFFPDVLEDPSQDIHFDVDDSKPRLTPFCSPLVAGKVVKQEGYSTKTFRPAYAKDKRVFLPDAPLRRSIGEPIGGILSPDQRLMMAVSQNLADQMDCLTRLEEKMAAEALIAGMVTVAGEEYPTTVVDFGRHSDLTVELLTTDRWGETDVDPEDDIEEWIDSVAEISGAGARVVVFEPKAWKLFRKSVNVREVLDIRRQASGSLELGPIVRSASEQARYVGNLGDVEFWVYQDFYTDDSGVTQQLLPDHTVIVGAPGLNGVMGTRCYAAVRDFKANMQAQRYFVKSWEEEDPSVRYLLMQSAPLVVPFRPNATLAAKVR